MPKKSLGWELDELEAAAQLVLESSTNSGSEQENSSEDSSSESSEESCEGSSSADEDESETSAIDESKQNCFDSEEAVASKTDSAEQQVQNISNEQQGLTLISPAQQTTPSLLEQLVNLSIQNQ